MSDKALIFLVIVSALLAVPASAQTRAKGKAPGRPPVKKPVSANTYYTNLRLDAAQAILESSELQKQGKIVEAAKALKKAVDIREYFVKTDREVPVLKERLAELWLATGKKHEAVAVLMDAMGNYAKWYGPGSDRSIKPLTLIAGVYSEDGDSEEALKLYNQAYAIAVSSKGANSSAAMKQRLLLACEFKKANKFDQAAPLYNEAFERQLKNEKLIDLKELIESLEAYSVCLKSLKKDDDASAVQARIEELKSKASGGASETTAETK